MRQVNIDFTCIHCKNFVSADPIMAGVQNRNHCPYCLYSRHVDLFEAGDRMAACKGEMRPVGLTMKRTRNKYARENQGELMLIHQCTACGKVSINRIAADDDADLLLEVLEKSDPMDEQLARQLEKEGIQALQMKDERLIRVQLFGKSDSEEE